MPELMALKAVLARVGSSRDLDQASARVADAMRRSLDADFTAVYMHEPGSDAPDLRAVETRAGVAEAAPAVVDALAAEVMHRREPLGRPAAWPDTAGGESQAYLLAVPLVHAGESLGALAAVRRGPEGFGEEVAEILVTVGAQVADAISRVRLREQIHGAVGGSDAGDRFYSGVPGAPGVAVGRVVVVDVPNLGRIPDRRPVHVGEEIVLFRAGISAFRAQLKALEAHDALEDPSGEMGDVLEAYRMLVGDQALEDQVVARIRAGNWAPGALRSVITEQAAVFEGLEDPYLRARAEDLRELGRRILECMLGRGDQGRPRGYPEACILVGDEIGVTQIAEVPAGRLAGLVSRRGSVLSHVAVLARALDLPAVMGLEELPLGEIHGAEVVVDGYQGSICVAPGAETLERYAGWEQESERLRRDLERLAELPARTPDGVSVALMSKAGMVAELGPAASPGVDGIGLYRTEFAFMARETFPGEEEQQGIYREALEALAPRPVVMRTLDAGGDKRLPYFSVEESNPFLGWRGIRMSLDHPELFLTQLRAMLLANVGLGNLQIMFPMVASIDEVDAALALLDQAHDELRAEHATLERPPVGIMVEVPSAVYLAPELLARVDFLSVGTNDLTQYLLAVDRDNARVAGRFDSLHPAVLRALADVARHARAAGKPVGICGEMAGEPEAVPLLVGMGYDNLSASPGRLPAVKALVRSMERTRAEDLARRALGLARATEVRALVASELESVGLGRLLGPGYG